jgi:hypothetical protein
VSDACCVLRALQALAHDETALGNAILPPEEDVSDPRKRRRENGVPRSFMTGGISDRRDDIVEIRPHHAGAEDAVGRRSFTKDAFQVLLRARGPPSLTPRRNIVSPKYSSGRPATPELRSRPASNPPPLRGMLQMRYDVIGRIPDQASHGTPF